MARIVIAEERCKGCRLCVVNCFQGLITISKRLNQAGYHPAVFNGEDKCTACTFCALMCPEIAIEVYK